MPRFLIGLINEAFGTGYSVDEQVILLNNTYTEENEEIITDLFVEICGERYHIECQSSKDKTMVIRMFEYGSHIAVEKAFQAGSNPIVIEFPHACVAYLRDFDGDGETLNAVVRMPNGETIRYEIPVIVASHYSAGQMYEKDLYLLLPFYVLRFEKALARLPKMQNDKSEEDALCAKIVEDSTFIAKNLNCALNEAHTITESEYKDLVSLILNVMNYTLGRNERIKKEAVNKMGLALYKLPSEEIAELQTKYEASEMSRREAEEGRREAEERILALERELKALRALAASSAQ